MFMTSFCDDMSCFVKSDLSGPMYSIRIKSDKGYEGPQYWENYQILETGVLIIFFLFLLI